MGSTARKRTKDAKDMWSDFFVFFLAGADRMTVFFRVNVCVFVFNFFLLCYHRMEFVGLLRATHVG